MMRRDGARVGAWDSTVLLETLSMTKKGPAILACHQGERLPFLSSKGRAHGLFHPFHLAPGMAQGFFPCERPCKLGSGSWVPKYLLRGRIRPSPLLSGLAK